MFELNIGLLLQNTRLEKNISQKQLCSGLCSIAQLSRYETGQRYPKKIMFDSLIERLGETTKNYNFISDAIDQKLSTTREKLIHYSMHHNTTKVDYFLNIYKSLSAKNDVLDNQFINMILANKLSNAKEKLEKYIETIKMTIPNFNISNISSYLLSHTEICIINAIACCYKVLDHKQKALSIFNDLAFYIDKNISSGFEKLRNQSLVLTNLTNLLLLNNQYIDTLYWSNKGIEICKKNHDSYFLPVLYHAKCIALKEIGNIEEAKKLAVYTYTLFKCNGQIKLANIIRKNIEETYNISFSINLI